MDQNRSTLWFLVLGSAFAYDIVTSTFTGLAVDSSAAAECTSAGRGLGISILQEDAGAVALLQVAARGKLPRRAKSESAPQSPSNAASPQSPSSAASPQSSGSATSPLSPGSAASPQSPGGAASTAEWVNSAPTAEERLQLLRPLAWVHVPKCGTSFFNAIYNHPGLCPLAPAGVRLPSAEDYLEPLTHVLREYPEDVACKGSISSTYTLMNHSRMHIGFGSPVFEANRGRGLIMLRQPEQRIISSYYDKLHDWNLPQPPADLREYAEGVRGCSVRMLTVTSSYPACFLSPLAPPPSEEEVDVAVQHLRDGFAFVGLTEEWDLSICLFHAKFGGSCGDHEFDNTRPGTGRPNDKVPYDTSALGGWVDVADRRLYAEARRIFERDLARFGVAASGCRAACRGAAAKGGRR